MSLQDLVLSGVKWEMVPETDRPIIEQSSEFTVETSTMPNTPREAKVIPPIPVVESSALQDTANAAAANAADSDALIAAIKNFKHPLSTFAATVLPQIRNSNLIIITDMPSDDDEKSGRVMHGAAGELLDKMLGSIGALRESVSIIPLLFWRTPGGRTPTDEELALARPFVTQAIKIACEGKRTVVLTLGALAAAEIANAKLPADIGKEIPLNDSLFLLPCIPIWHPNYLILKPDAKRDVWSALQKVQNFLQMQEK